MGEVVAAGLEQHCNVLIVELVVDVASVAPVAHHARGAQEPKRLADPSDWCVEGFSDITDTLLAAIEEQVQDLYAARVAEQSEHVCEVVGGSEVQTSCRYLHNHEYMRMTASLQRLESSH